MEPLPEFDVDDKDPHVFKKTLEHEKKQREWDTAYCDRKQHISYEILTLGMPHQFLEYFQYCGSLKFEQRPNYEFLIGLFDQLFKDMGFANDDEYDWVLHKRRLIDRRHAKENEEKRIRLLHFTNQPKLDKKKVEQINRLEVLKLREKEQEAAEAKRQKTIKLIINHD
jgi:hypothetical protein